MSKNKPDFNSCGCNESAFWENHLQDIPEQIQLPYDYSRPQIVSDQTVHDVFSLSSELSHRVKVFCSGHALVPETFFLASFKLFLWKYSGQETVVVGVPLESGQASHRGCTPVRTDIDSCVVVSNWYTKVQDALVENQQRQLLDLAQLITAIGFTPTPNSHPVYQVSFRHRADCRPTQLKDMLQQTKATQPLDLSFYSSGTTAFGCAFVFSADLFQADRVKRFKTHFIKIVEWVVANGDATLDGLSLLTKADLEQIGQSNDTARPEFLGKVWLDLFSRTVDRSPAKEAVRFKGKGVTYSELDQASTALSSLLIKHGVGKGDVVGVLVSRGVESLTALIAIMKSGGVYVPLDPQAPVDRLHYIVQDSGLKYLIVDDSTMATDLLSEHGPIPIHASKTKLEEGSVKPDYPAVEATDLAYMIYTSGSTGRPKGVPINHDALANFLLSTAETPGIDDHDVVIALGSTAFDISLPEMLLPLISGASLVIGTSESVQDGAELARLLAAEQVTYMLATPVTWMILFESGWQGKHDLKMLSAGDILSPSLLAKMLDAGAEVWNGYGTTETTIMSSYFQVGKNREPLIGQPMANTGYYVLDKYDHVVPPGIVGELAISGVGLSPGYTNQRGLTVKAFVDLHLPDSNSIIPIYKTGDLSQQTCTGDYRYLGRADAQVKIRGYRIELGEIEAQLAQYPDIVDCCCSLFTYSEMDKRLIAYYRAQASIAPKSLREFLVEKIPAYMVPAVFVHMEEFPKNQNQKIDKKLLPIPGDDDFPKPERLDLESLLPLEKDVFTIWQDVLRHSDIGLDDHFFDIGGSSLSATLVLMKIRSLLGKAIPLSLLYEYPTIQECSAVLEGYKQEPLVSQAPLVHENRESWLLSAQQERLWFFHELFVDSPAYNVAQTFWVKGDVNLDLLEQAVTAIVGSHESFNCSVLYCGDGQVALRRVNEEIDLKIVDLQEMDSDQQEQRFQQDIVAQNRARKDLAGRTSGITFYIYTPKEIVVALFMPHIFTDGISFNIFQKQVFQAYANLVNGVEVFAGISLLFQYSDYSTWLLDNPLEEGEDDGAFWQEYLFEIPEQIQLPYTYPRPQSPSYAGDAVTFALSPKLHKQVQERCRALKITPFVFLLANFFLLLWKYSGQNTLVVGAPYANRNHEDVQDIIGFFVEMLPIRGDIDPQVTVEQWFSLVNKSFLKGMENKDLGFSKIVESLEHRRQINSHPIFQVVFAYQEYLKNSSETATVQMEQFFTNRGVAEYDLALYAWENDGLNGVFEFATELFDRQTIQRLQSHFVAIVNWSVTSHDAPLGTLSLLSKEDWKCIDSVNHTARPSFLGQTCLNLFDKRVAITPTREAVRFEGKSLTCRQLDDASTHLANILGQEGVRKGDFVGVFVSRSLAIEVALLGVLKSGATYVPLDPNFPVERLRYIASDSAMKFVVTDDASSAMDLVQSPELTVVNLDQLPAQELSRNDTHVTPVAADLAYMIYTSGSTGNPKGVPITHGALANFLLSAMEAPGITDRDVVVGLTTTSFDIAFLELLLPLVAGATLVIADADTARNGEALGQLLKDEAVTFMQATPATWTILCESGWCGKKDLKIVTGGESLSEKLACRLLQSGYEVWNAYGPTETTIWSSYAQITENKPVSIGRPIANTVFYVLDENLNSLPPGLIGELAIGGYAVSPGYHNREELSQQVFTEIVMPFLPDAVPVYRTGDLVQLTPEGTYRCLGRQDNQVKIRGFRIELGEIERQLSTHEDVVDCCAVVAGSGHNKKIVAYFTSGSAPSWKELQLYLKKTLPAYMVPGSFIHMAEFPKTPNQKIDRKALPSLSDSDVPARRDVIAPATATEQVILKIWQEILETDKISVDDTYFDIGGSSLSAILLVATINKHFSTEVPLLYCFQNPTIRSFATYLDDYLANRGVSTQSQFKNLIKINSSGDKTPLVLVHGDAANDFLPKVLGPAQPFYGFLHQGADGRKMQWTQVEDIAKHYLKELQQQVPHGPYVLSGYSFGGLIALYMAYLLEMQNEHVDGLILFDTIHPAAMYGYSWRTFPVKAVKKIVKWPFDTYRDLCTALIVNCSFLVERLIPASYRARYIVKSYHQMSKSHTPPSVSCPVALLQAEQGVTSDHLNGWSGITSAELRVDTVAGDHLGMVRDFENHEPVSLKIKEILESWQSQE